MIDAFEIEENNCEESMGKKEKERTIEQEKVHKIPFPGFGILCALLCGAFFGVNALFSKLITSIHPIQMGVSRCFVQFLILLPVVQYKSKTMDVSGPKGKTGYLLLRGFLGSTAMLFLYLAVGKLSLGNAVTISFLNTVMVPIIARVWLKESLTVLDCIFAGTSLFGVILIAQPPFLFPSSVDTVNQDPIGILYAFLSAAFASCTFVTIRKLGKETHFVLNIFYYSGMGAITTTTLLIGTSNFRFPCHSELFYVFGLGILGVLGQSCLTLALHWERAGTVSVLRTVQIIMVYAFQIILLNDVPSVLSIIGATLIFLSSLGIGIRKIVNEKKRA